MSTKNLAGIYRASRATEAGSILKRYSSGPEGEKERKVEGLYWRAHDFFTAEVLTLSGLKTFYLLFFLHFESRRICLAGATRHQVVFEPESFR